MIDSTNLARSPKKSKADDLRRPGPVEWTGEEGESMPDVDPLLTLPLPLPGEQVELPVDDMDDVRGLGGSCCCCWLIWPPWWTICPIWWTGLFGMLSGVTTCWCWLCTWASGCCCCCCGCCWGWLATAAFFGGLPAPATWLLCTCCCWGTPRPSTGSAFCLFFFFFFFPSSWWSQTKNLLKYPWREAECLNKFQFTILDYEIRAQDKLNLSFGFLGITATSSSCSCFSGDKDTWGHGDKYCLSPRSFSIHHTQIQTQDINLIATFTRSQCTVTSIWVEPYFPSYIKRVVPKDP